MTDPLLTAPEVARRYNCSENYVRNLFRNHPGVVVLPSLHRQPGKRTKKMLRIPKSLAESVLKSYTVTSNR